MINQINNLQNEVKKLQTAQELEKQQTQNFISFIGISGVAVMLSAFLLSLTGVVDLRILNEINVNKTTDIFISYFLFMVNIIFFFKVIEIERIHFNIFIFSLILILLSFYVVEENFYIITIFFPCLYFLFNILKNKKYFVLNKLLIYCILIFVLQQILSFIKLGYFNFENININILIKILFSIDLFLIYIYLLKGGERLVYAVEYIFSTKEKRVFKADNSLQELATENELTPEQRIKFFALAMSYQFAQLFIVLFLGLIHNMAIELFIMLFNFWIGRKILGNCWHSDTLSWCSIATFISFYILIKITPPLQISLFLVLITSGAFTYIMYKIGKASDRLEELENRYNEDFTKYGLTAYKSQIAHEYKIQGLSLKEQAERYQLSEKVISKYRTEINNAIKSYKG